MGDHRIPIITDQLNLNTEFGFDRRRVQGTKKALLTLQTQSYSPWDVLGFRINPFASLTMGVIGTEERKLFKSPLYSRIGLGVLLYNDYLVFNSFQLSLAFYPTIPGSGNNIFRTNTIENTDIVLPDFQVGKPGAVPYN